MSDGSSAKQADPHRAGDGLVLGFEQWGWRVRFKADQKRAAGPWSWQDKPLDEKTSQWAEEAPVYVATRQAATPAPSQAGIGAADEPTPAMIAASQGEGVVDPDHLRSIIHSATHAVLPLVDDVTGLGIRTRATMQVEIADRILARQALAQPADSSGGEG